MLFYQCLTFASQITNTHSHIICLLPTIVAPHISAYYVLTRTMFSKRYQREENKISDSVTESLIDYSVQSYVNCKVYHLQPTIGSFKFTKKCSYISSWRRSGYPGRFWERTASCWRRRRQTFERLSKCFQETSEMENYA